MINPGVIKLFSNNDSEMIGIQTRFEVEDNIGECIHIHYGNIRIDLSIEEFNQLVIKFKDIINNIVDLEDFNIDDFDSLFIAGNGVNMPFLKGIEKMECLLSELKIDTMNQDGTVIVDNLYNSRVYRAFNGDTREDDSKKQINVFLNAATRCTNEERRNYHLKNVDGDAANNAITINEYNQICDGQHRAASLLKTKGDIKVEVRKMIYGREVDINNFGVINTHDELMMLINFCNVHERIFLYGAGKYAKKLKLLLELNDIDIQGFITTVNERESYCCKKVISSEMYRNSREENDGVIIAFLAADEKEIMKNTQVQKQNVYKVDLRKIEQILGNVL